jgi:hypothetical protein
MKNLLLLITAVLISIAAATAQSCLPEGITFSTQEQIDNFQTNYPGCTEIEGNVKIQGAGITNLNGLSVITSIGGFLFISNNLMLTDLIGLDNISAVGGNFRIENNNALTSLSGLESLNQIGRVHLHFPKPWFDKSYRLN